MLFEELFDTPAFDTTLLFLHRGVLPPKAGIGHHYHNQTEEMFELTIAGGTGNGYMLSQLRGAVNPSGWSGVIEVKNPAGVTAGYILLYTNP